MKLEQGEKKQNEDCIRVIAFKEVVIDACASLRALTHSIHCELWHSSDIERNMHVMHDTIIYW
jgi:hypothetical protein